MRWWHQQDPLVGLFQATARPPLTRRLARRAGRVLPVLLLAIFCVACVASPLLLTQWW